MLSLGPEWLTIILFGSLVLLLMAGVPLVFAIGGVATFFIILLWGPHALPILANRTYMAMDMFLLAAVPMFIFMGAMLQRCGIAEGISGRSASGVSVRPSSGQVCPAWL
jgi:TRAP-type mannitol/chloroaromatic compound transport system permease large subunit